METYLNLIKENMLEILKLIFEKDFKKTIFEKFWESYANARYYDFSGKKGENDLKKYTVFELEIQKEELLRELPKESKVIENMHLFFTKIMYFDEIVPNKNLDKSIEEIDELRKKLLNNKDNKFKENLSKLVNEKEAKVETFYKKYDSPEFLLKISNYKVDNAYKVTLKYNFKMNMVYSDVAIKKAFETGVVNEDKLIIGYNLISLQIIQDVIRGNLKKHYIVEFAESLFSKKQKLERLLSLIENSIIQDKLSLKLTHEVFLKNKEKVYELMKRGFKFTIIIDNTFESSLETLEKLNMFKYILVNKEAKWSYQIIERKELTNVIVI